MKQSNIFKPTLKFSQKTSVSNETSLMCCTVHVHYNVYCSVHRAEHCTIEITVQSCNSCTVSTRLCCTTRHYTALHYTTLYCTKVH